MSSVVIDLGGGTDYLAPLYTLPVGSNPIFVEVSVGTWFQQTLSRDGYANIAMSVRVTKDSGTITLTSSDGGALPPGIEAYQGAMKSFLSIGSEAWTSVVPELKRDGKWDPQGTGKWHFFLPHGLPMLNFYTIQFFHYPPLRLLELGDYLKDPVPDRWKQLLEKAGAEPTKTDRYQRYMDAVPIAAPDDQGAYMPVADFVAYQTAMTELFLNLTSGTNQTVPVLVFGIPAMAQFEHLFRANLDILVPQVAKILPNKTTPCLGATHPYHFYAQAQIDHGKHLTIGDGEMGRGCQLANVLMQQDLIAAFWQTGMVKEPSTGVGEMLFAATSAALNPAMAPTVCALTAHQGSLWYPNPDSLEYQFKVSPEQAETNCAKDANNPCAGIG